MVLEGGEEMAELKCSGHVDRLREWPMKGANAWKVEREMGLGTRMRYSVMGEGGKSFIATGRSGE